MHGNLIDALEDIDRALDSSHDNRAQKQQFLFFCFGYFLGVYHEGPDDKIQFAMGKKECKLTKIKFYLITGLKFGVPPDISGLREMEEGINQRYFDCETDVTKEDVRTIAIARHFESLEDAAKLCLLYILHRFLYGYDEQDKVSLWQLSLVEDLDAFYWFSWGTLLYQYFIEHWNRALRECYIRVVRRQHQRPQKKPVKYNL